MLIIKRLFVFMGLLGMALTAVAAQELNLYRGEVAVQSQQEDEREQAIQQALTQVLVKVSGDSHVAQQLGADIDSDKASELMQQYHYVEIPQDDEDGEIVRDDLMIYVDFDQPAINAYLQSNNALVWQGYRPLTIVWVAAEEGRKKALLGEYEAAFSDWQAAFTAQTMQRGVPVLFPLLDLTDQQVVEQEDVSKHNTAVLQQATQRYQGEHILSGHVYESEETDLWTADWVLNIESEQVRWQQTAASPQALMQASANRFADELAARYVLTQAFSEQLSVLVHVDNIRGMQDYLQVLDYLQALDATSAVETLQLAPSQAVFSLDLIQQVPLLEETLRLDTTLTPVAPSQAGQGSVLRYQYQNAGVQRF